MDDEKRRKRIRFADEIAESTDIVENADEIERVKKLRCSLRENSFLDDESKGGEQDAEPPGVEFTEKWKRFSRSSETAPMEPFHMEGERRMGSFDASGHFIFKKKGSLDADGSDSEPDDAEIYKDDFWLADLRERQRRESEGGVINGKSLQAEVAETARKHREREEHIAVPTETDLIASEMSTKDLLMELTGYLNSDQEAPVQALKRFKGKAAKMDPETQRKFDRVTALCDVLAVDRSFFSALLTKRESLLKEIPNVKDEKTANESSEPLWQFQWQRGEDKEIHGPVTTAQLETWVRQEFISAKNPVQLREVLSGGELVDTAWRSWTFLRGSEADEIAAENIRQEISKKERKLQKKYENDSDDYEDDAEIDL